MSMIHSPREPIFWQRSFLYYCIPVRQIPFGSIIFYITVIVLMLREDSQEGDWESTLEEGVYFLQPHKFFPKFSKKYS